MLIKIRLTQEKLPMPNIVLHYFDVESNENKNLLVKVPCEYRAQCYQHLLDFCSSKFRDNLAGQNSADANLIKEALLNTNLLESLAQLLDNVVLDFLEFELENNKKVRWKEINLTSISDDEARILLIDYYKNPESGKENITLKNYLLNKYPKLKQLIDDITIRFIEHIELIVSRVIKHCQILSTKFLSLRLPQEQLSLTKIVFSESGDRHKLGQQVYFLDFRLKNNEVKRIVYKPFNIKADALILGKTDSLDKYKFSIFSDANTESLIEVFNKYLPKKLKLPTYLIFPCVSDTIKDDYGFIEYIEHEPWPKLPINELIQEYVQNEMPKNEVNKLEAINTFMSNKFDASLEKLGEAVLKKEAYSDFIIDIDDHKSFDNYSRQCGILLAIMLIMKISDFHIENLILHSKNPYLIDLDFTFQPQVTSVIDTVSLDATVGAMRANAVTTHKWRYLYDARGIEFGEITLPSKNRLYRSNQSGKLSACEPSEVLLKEGFALALEILHLNNQIFLNWLGKETLKSLVVRVIPFSTSQLKHIEFALAERATQKQCEKYLLETMTIDFTEEWLNNLRSPTNPG